MSETRPTIVLVHGAFADASSWSWCRNSRAVTDVIVTAARASADRP